MMWLCTLALTHHAKRWLPSRRSNLTTASCSPTLTTHLSPPTSTSPPAPAVCYPAPPLFYIHPSLCIYLLFYPSTARGSAPESAHRSYQPNHSSATHVEGVVVHAVHSPSKLNSHSGKLCIPLQELVSAQFLSHSNAQHLSFDRTKLTCTPAPKNLEPPHPPRSVFQT